MGEHSKMNTSFSRFLDELEEDEQIKRDRNEDSYYLELFYSLLRTESKKQLLEQWRKACKDKEADLTAHWEKDYLRLFTKEERLDVFSDYMEQTKIILERIKRETLPILKKQKNGFYEYGRWYNGKEQKLVPLEWQVVTEKSGELLLTTTKAIDCMPYEAGPDETAWEQCSLYQWLNKDFWETAFNTKEQNAVHKNPDAVFLLSRKEIDLYLKQTKMRQITATEYAHDRGALLSSDNKCCWWWLRTKGSYEGIVMVVYPSGMIDENRVKAKDHRIGVRPAIWVDKAMVLEVKDDNV